METMTTTLLIILGSVSGVLILILIILGIQIWRLIHTLQKIANVFADETDHVRNIFRKARAKVSSMME